MHRWSGVLITLAIAACGSFGTGSGATNDAGSSDAAPNTPTTDAASGDGGGDGAPRCDIPACAGSGCVKYSFTASCPPPDWAFGGDNESVKECRNDRIHISADGSLDVSAELSTRTPGSLRGARIELRFAIKHWAVLSGERGRMIVAGSQGGTGIGITAIETPSKTYALQLCGADNEGLRNCVDLATVSAATEHVLSLDWSDTSFVATVDCRATATQVVSRLAGNQDFGLAFGVVDAMPIDGTIGDVVVSFR